MYAQSGLHRPHGAKRHTKHASRKTLCVGGSCSSLWQAQAVLVSKYPLPLDDTGVGGDWQCHAFEHYITWKQSVWMGVHSLPEQLNLYIRLFKTQEACSARTFIESPKPESSFCIAFIENRVKLHEARESVRSRLEEVHAQAYYVIGHPCSCHILSPNTTLHIYCSQNTSAMETILYDPIAYRGWSNSTSITHKETPTLASTMLA